WLGFWSYLAVPGGVIVVLAGLLLVCRERAVRRLLLVLLLVLPGFFCYVRLRSTYPFSDRYYSPFFGLGWVAFVWSIAAAGKAVRLAWDHGRVAQWLRPALAGAAVAGLLGYVGLVNWRHADLLALPSRNFSPYHRIYRELKVAQGPVFVLYGPCSCWDLAPFY